MSNLNKKLASAVAAGALLLNLATPAFASTFTLEISGNGSDSDSEVNLEQSNEVTVEQNNWADVQNDVNVKANTGDNEAEDNTGGDVAIETGDSETNVSVSNTLNSNVASVDSCCVGDVQAKISGNGTDSDNDIDLDLDHEVKVEQNNDAVVINRVSVKSETGDNDAEDNTGGDVSIKTGDADTTVDLSTAANANSALVSGDGEGGSLSAWILGNGSDSDNEIDLDLDNKTKVEQNNWADVLNDVNVKSETGDNDAEDNTGGEVEIETGDATADVTVDNLVNFNWADIDGCGCLEDLLAKISGNGTDSENEIKADLETELKAEQNNDFDCKGEIKDACADVDVKLETGDNDAEDNTLGGDDPTIETGDADADVDVSNSANSNVFGEVPDLNLDFPWFDLNLNISFDLSDLLEALLG